MLYISIGLYAHTTSIFNTNWIINETILLDGYLCRYFLCCYSSNKNIIGVIRVLLPLLGGLGGVGGDGGCVLLIT